MSKPKSEKQQSNPGKEPKATKELKPKKERKPTEPLVVFAFRLKPEERDAIHRAAGPGKATKFVLATALSAAKQVRTEK